MPENKPEEPKDTSGLTKSIQAFVRNRAGKQNDKTPGVRKHVEIQLLISELDNILLHMSANDPAVVNARDKLLELKKLIGKTLDIKLN
jgi:hypothetical protein